MCASSPATLCSVFTGQPILILIILNLIFLMQVVLSATLSRLSRLYYVLRDFHMSTDTLV